MLFGHFAARGSGVLNVPSWALAYTVCAVAVVTILVSRTRHVSRPAARTPPVDATGPGQRSGATPGRGTVTAQVFAGVVLVGCVGFAWWGPVGITSNLAPLILLGVLWPLGGWAALAAGWCFEAADPFGLVARIGDRRRAGRGAAPVRAPWWAPVPVFATWVVVWIAWIRGDEPRNLAVWLTGYVLAMSLVAVFGGTATLRAANPLPATLDLTAAISRPGQAGRRWHGDGDRARVATIAALLMGAVAANRAADTAWFTTWFDDPGAVTATFAVFGIFLVSGAGIAAVWWGLDRRVARARGESEGRPIATALAPVAGGLLLAQGLPVGLVAAQNLAIVASDPLGRGWDVFGTVYWQVTPDPLSGFTMGLVQTAAILLGLVSGLAQVGRGATARAADGTTTAVARYRSWNAALPAFVLLGAGGVVWTLWLVGR